MAIVKNAFGITTNNLAQMNASGGTQRSTAETFTVGTAYTCSGVILPLSKSAANGPVVASVSIYAVDGDRKPTGSALASGTVSTANLTTSMVWTVITFSSTVALSAGIEYAVVVYCTSGTGIYLNWFGQTSAGSTYAGKCWLGGLGATPSWTEYTTADCGFQVFDNSSGTDPGTLQTGLQGYWPLNDNRANKLVEDTSGNDNDGTVSRDTANLTTTGKIGNAFDFDEAQSDNVNCGDIAEIDLAASQDVAYSLWVKRGAAPTATLPVALSKYVANAGFLVWLEKASHDINCGFYYAGGLNFSCVATPTDSTAWHHVVINVDRSGLMELILDNGLYYNSTTISTQETTDLSNSASLLFGKSATYPNANFEVFDGCLDAIGVWNRLLTWPEITYLYGQTGGGAEAPNDSGGGGDLSDATYSVKHVAVGNNCVYYENASGDMVILSGSSGTLDCNEGIDMFSADGKVFIVNDDVKKVIDFRNTKIVTAAIGATVPIHGEVLTGQTSSPAPSMVVDFITASSGACTIYGYRTTAATFAASEHIHGTACTEFTMTAVAEVAPDPPHYYNWTTYANDTATYGSIPAKVTIGKWYFGRAVLSGNVQDPHQWYMSYVLNPWDFNYGASTADELRAIAGGYAAAGKIPDVQMAVIPYRDDYCIFGCASSCYYLTGNPTSGGEIAELKGTGGLLSKTSWTWDAKGFLYLLTSMGLLRVPPGFGPPENLTVGRWPDFISDLAYSGSTHRLTMGYDQKRNGIEISKTTIATGDNTCWWYDLNTEGLFPESYPDAQGFFSQYYSEDEGKLILGGFDGYLRHHDDSKNDDGTAIDAYFTLGPLPLGNSPTSEGSIGPVEIVLAGSASGALETDSDDASFKIFTADTAADLIEEMYLNGVPAFGGTANGPGRFRGGKRSQTARGIYGGIRIWNSTASEAFIFECCNIGASPKGRGK